MKPLQSLLLAAAVGMPLTSCVEWRIGKNIREAGKTITALQMSTPVDDRIYASRKTPPVDAEKEWQLYSDREDKNTTYYARVPVVEYGHHSSTIYWHLPHAIGGTFETKDRLTGQSRMVAIRDSKILLMPADFELPEDVQPVCADTPFRASGHGHPKASPNEAIRLRMYSWHQDLATSESVLATITAAPFDYLIDPALTVTSTTVVATIAGIGIGVWWLGDTLASPFSQSEPASKPQAPSSPTNP